MIEETFYHPSFVYVVLVAGSEGTYSVKVGKSNHPEKRARTYLVHCPVDSMHAIEVESEAAAFSAESRLIASVRRIRGAAAIGGEWTRIPEESLDVVFCMLQRFGKQIFKIDTGRYRHRRRQFYQT